MKNFLEFTNGEKEYKLEFPSTYSDQDISSFVSRSEVGDELTIGYNKVKITKIIEGDLYVINLNVISNNRLPRSNRGGTTKSAIL